MASDIHAFLGQCGWQNAEKTRIAGDASSRQYTRLTKPDGMSAILMDARKINAQSTQSFLSITRFLRYHGFSAPQIYAKTADQTLILLEDLGNGLLASVAEKNPEIEYQIYCEALRVLVALRGCTPPPDLVKYDPTEMSAAIGPVFEFYAGSAQSAAEITDALKTCLSEFSPDATVIALRDFHAENLLWMPERKGIHRIGLIDYQDAVIAHPAYDLASILRDVRRDVSPGLAARLLAFYTGLTGENPDEFHTAFAIQGVQRNLRILGVFARLCILHGKQAYIDLIPRVWKNLCTDLDHPPLAKLKALVLDTLPAPTPEKLDGLRSACKTNQPQ